MRYAIFHQPNTKFPQRAAKMLGFTPEQIQPGLLVPVIGNTYSGSAIIGLTAVLDVAQPGDRILLVSFGSGAGSDAFAVDRPMDITGATQSPENAGLYRPPHRDRLRHLRPLPRQAGHDMTLPAPSRPDPPVVVAGAGMTPVGEHWEISLRHLALQAIELAVQDAGGLQPDALFVGNMLAPALTGQTHLGVLIADFAGLRGIEASAFEAARRLRRRRLSPGLPGRRLGPDSAAHWWWASRS